MQNETAPASDNTPVGGYAPGFYWCACRDCGLRFHGAKLSHQCRPCALAAASAHASPAGNAPDDEIISRLRYHSVRLMAQGDRALADVLFDAVRALRAHAAKSAVGVLEPTDEMVDAGRQGLIDGLLQSSQREAPDMVGITRAVLTAALAAAAPQPEEPK